MPDLFVADAGLVFVAVNAEVIALSKVTGNQLGTYALGDGMGSVAALNSRWPKVWFASNTGAVIAYDIASLLQCWTGQFADAGNIGILETLFKSQVLVVLGSLKLVLLNPTTGSVQLKLNHACPIVQQHVSPQGFVAALGEDGSLRTWRLTPGGDCAKPIWAGSASAESSAMTIYRDFLLLGSTVVSCYALRAGATATLLWSTSPRPGESDDSDASNVTCLGAVATKNSDALRVVVGRANNVVQCYFDAAFTWEGRHGRCGEGAEGATSLGISADGTTLFTGAWDHCVRAWDLAKGTPVLGTDELIEVHGRSDPGTLFRYEQDNHGSHEWGVQKVLALDGGLVLSGGHDGHVRLWNTADASHVWGYKHGMDVFRAVVDGDAIFAGVTNYTVQRWDAFSGVLQWSTFLGGAMRAMDMVVYRGVVFIAVVNCSVFALDATSGDILWHARPISNWTVLVQAHAEVCVTASNCDTTDKGEHLVVGWAYRPTEETGERLWELTIASDVDLGAVVSCDEGDTADTCAIVAIGVPPSEKGGEGSWIRGVKLLSGATAWEFRDLRVTAMRALKGHPGMLVAASANGKACVLSLYSGAQLVALKAPQTVSHIALSDSTIFLAGTGESGNPELAAYAHYEANISTGDGPVSPAVLSPTWHCSVPGGAVSCLTANEGFVVSAVQNIAFAFSATTGRSAFRDVNHTNPISWLGTTRNRLCSSTSNNLVALDLRFLKWFNIHIRSVDFEAGSRATDAFAGCFTVGAMCATVGAMLASLTLYAPFINYVKECVFLVIRVGQWLGFAYAVVTPPRLFALSINVPLSFLQHFSVLKVTFPLNLISPLALGIIVVVLVGSSKRVLYNAFVAPDSKWVITWAAMDQVVGVLLGPLFLPLSQVYLRLWSCADAHDGRRGWHFDHAVECYSDSHVLSASIGTLIALVYFYTVFRMLRCCSALAAIDGSLRWSHDIVSSAPTAFEHPLTEVNGTSSKVAALVGVCLTIGIIAFPNSPIYHACTNIAVTSLLIIVEFRYKPFSFELANWLMRTLAIMTVYHQCTSLLVELVDNSAFAAGLPFTTFAFFLLALGVKLGYVARRLPTRVHDVSTDKAISEASDDFGII